MGGWGWEDQRDTNHVTVYQGRKPAPAANSAWKQIEPKKQESPDNYLENFILFQPPPTH